MTILPRVSVVIPAYNAAQTIYSCVDAVLHQQGDFEFLQVIVVDDGSADGTAEIVKTFDRVEYLSQSNAGPAVARNRGASAAKGDFLFFTDADCVPEPQWLKTMMRYFADPDVMVVAGSYGISNPQNRLAWCVHQEILFRHHFLMGEWIEVFGSYNVGFRRIIFQKLCGFNEGYRAASGEDNDLSYRLRMQGYQIRFAREALVAHRHPVSVRRYLFEQGRHGYWRAKMYKIYPGRLAGDGYTFWKDSVEFGLVFLTAIIFGLSVFGSVSWRLPSFLLFAWLTGEIFFALRFNVGGVISPVFYGLVMFVRSWTRALGFVSGIFFGK